MWNQGHPSTVPQAPVQIIPSDVYYEFDEPVLFRTTIGITNFVFLKVGETVAENRYLVATPSQQALEAMAESRLSVWGLFDSSFYAVMDVARNGQLSRYWRTEYTDLPAKLLPKRGVGVAPGLEWVPDTIDQSEAFFAVRFSGERLSQGRMTFQTLKKLTTEFYDAIRLIIAPLGLENAKSGTYDFPVGEPAFGSLILALEEPNINIGAVRKHLDDENLNEEDIRAQFFQQNLEFFNRLGALKEAAQDGELEGELANANFQILKLLQDITPNDSVPFDQVEFSANINGQMHYISIGQETGARFKRAYTNANGRQKTVIGIIEIINNKSKTFVIRVDGERQVTCNVLAAFFVELAGQDDFKNGATIRVTGRYFRRKWRDSLDVEAMPEILAAAGIVE